MSLTYILFWNIPAVSAYTMLARAAPLGQALGLRQEWNVFAPAPAKITEWHVIPGQLQNGQRVNLLGPTVRGDPHMVEPVSGERPPSVPDTFDVDVRWRKYLSAVGTSGDPNLYL